MVTLMVELSRYQAFPELVHQSLVPKLEGCAEASDILAWNC